MEDKPIKKQPELSNDLQNKSLFFRLKKWEKDLFKYIKNLFVKEEYVKEHIENMKKQKNDFINKVKEENNDYLIKKQQIEEEKKREINLIEENKNKTNLKNKKKYKDLISQLESIKNDREKLIEFFSTIS